MAKSANCARALEPFGVYWLEEPLRTDDLDGYAALRRSMSVRIAAGEMVRGAHEPPRARTVE
jgi:L-alanine-DL-glutamate epimerase-like enolase superfamily enzyme